MLVENQALAHTTTIEQRNGDAQHDQVPSASSLPLRDPLLRRARAVGSLDGTAGVLLLPENGSRGRDQGRGGDLLVSNPARVRHRMRCRRCRKRFTLKRDPWRYARAVRCPACKTVDVRSDEENRRREASRQDTCRCLNYPFPHRKGSLVFCEHATEEPTEEDHWHYLACLETRRGSGC